MPHEWTMPLSENAFFGFAALAIFVICWAICKDLKKIDEEAERKIKGMFKGMFNDLSAMSESDEDMLAAQQRRRMAKRAA